MPEDVHWTYPAGGYSCWLTLPDRVENAAVVHMAMRQGFAFTPGDVFMVDEHDATSHLRICFAGQPERYIEEAIQVLSQVIRDLRY
jgi:DNA-binding transcriptional MocR family regulator